MAYQINRVIMNPIIVKETKQKIAVMQAYLQGETIQYRFVNRVREEWIDCSVPLVWDWVYSDYRVKPKTREMDAFNYKDVLILIEKDKSHLLDSDFFHELTYLGEKKVLV